MLDAWASDYICCKGDIVGLEKVPFVRYNENKKDDTFTVKLNKDERELLERMKESLDIKSDSKALKLFALIGFKSATSMFSEPFLKYLFKKDRVRLSDYKNIFP